MLHSSVGQTNFIGHLSEAVYKASPIGNLEQHPIKGIVPLQEAFQCGIPARISVGVHDNPAFATSEQGVVSTVMSLPDSTAAGTELRCVPRIHYVERDVLVKAAGGKNLLELEEGRSHDDPVELPGLGPEPFKVLYGDVRVVPQGKIGYLPDHLAEVGIDEVELPGLQPPQSGKVAERLHDGTPRHYLPSFGPDMQPEVCLVQDPVRVREYGDGNPFRIEIDPEHVPLWSRYGFVFTQIRNDPEPGSQPVGLACPAGSQKIGISLEIAVPDDGNRDRILGKQGELHKRHALVKNLAVAGDIELQGDSPDPALASPDRTFDVADYLRVKGGAFLAG